MPYAELHCKTNFSFLEGASHASELAARAAELGYAALAVTDRNSLAGIVRAHGAAKDLGLKLLVGAEVTPRDAPPVVLWATDRAAYGRLCRLLTIGRRRAPKGECELRFADIAEYSEGLLAGVIPLPLQGEGLGEGAPRSKRPPQNQPSPPPHPLPMGEGALARYRELFGDRAYLLAELLRDGDDRGKLASLQALARRTGLPLLAAGDVHYHAPERHVVHDVLTAIRTGATVAGVDGGPSFANAQRHLRPVEEIAALFAPAPDAVARTVEVADRCHFSLDELRFEYPTELAPDGLTPIEFLTKLTWQGAAQRYPDGVPPKVRQQIEHELTLIRELRYEAYFLTVWDLVRYARSRNILCQGRGSAANSAVCYALGVTSVDPATSDLLFERFVSKERGEAPDIDVDFEHERREEVLQYLYQKYGRDRAGLAATVITYCARSVVRDVGKALGLSPDRVDALAKQLEGYREEPKLAQRCAEVGIDPGSPLGKRLIYVVTEMIGFPRHLSQHVGGMIITQGPLCELAPIENAAMEDRTVIPWDKDDLDELGILKVDCLCLGMLTAIHKCFDLIEQHEARPLTLASVPQEDPAVYDMICRADTLGVFQIESRAQMTMLPRLKPRTFYDLVIEVAIVRPGPIQGQMVHPYLRRRQKLEDVVYPNDAIRQVLHKTLGVPIFQEQAMKLAVVAAGFTPGEADQLRRAMAAWRRPGVIDAFRKKLLDGMLATGLSEEFALRVYQQIRGFGEYGFPESHAASFALLVYVSAWLKHYYPAAFCAAMVNSQPLGFYAPAQLVRDAREHGVEVLGVDVNRSAWDCTLEGGRGVRGERTVLPPRQGEGWGGGGAGTRGASEADFVPGAPPPLAPPPEGGGGLRAACGRTWMLRLGLRMISGLREDDAEAIVLARGAGPFTSIDDFSRRTGLGQAVIARLAGADAFGSLEVNRREALWQALAEERGAAPQPLFDALPAEDEALPELLPVMGADEEVAADYRATALSLRAHPVSFHRDALTGLGVTTAAGLKALPNGLRVAVAGLVLMRQRPATAKGITFVTLEDETGVMNLVLHPRTWERYYRTARRAGAWIVHGELQSAEGIIHVVVQKLTPLADGLASCETKSRDFR
ncbi:Error-prone DNA polymerase [Pirellulimonas nuda]|uniref:Error-prone DNA polymerase n=1 Tax=Pirellulimonas nuda TaxID=2528009 RepID=A0A518DJ40_9BACT|nr:error-prone DNA polymerase [Pirellulimonas nuda]QDU91483.1 Error-prone DNA polymerase [Pirellulimonas nuda]